MLSLCSFQLGTPTQRADISLEGLGSSKEMALSGNFSEPQEEREKRIEEKTPVVKESRSLPPAGDLLTRRLPAGLVGDTLEVTYSLSISSFSYLEYCL